VLLLTARPAAAAALGRVVLVERRG
jgi:hypothetical protein